VTTLYNLVRVTSTSTGTGSPVLAGSAVSPWLSFSTGNVTSGSYVTYAIQDATNSEIGQGTYTSSNGAVTRTKILASTNGGAAINLTGTQQLYLTASAQDFQGFQCGRLTYVSSGSISFSPFNGDLIRINGSTFQIPAAGISATSTNTYVNGSSAATLATSTVYLVTVFNNAGTLTLDFLAGSTSSIPASHSADTGSVNTGVEIPSTTANSSRSVVGMVRTSSNAVSFVDTATQRFVRSWFNPKAAQTSNVFTATRVTSATSYAEINSEIRNEFLIWSDETLNASFAGSAYNSSTTGGLFSGISIDGSLTPENGTAYAEPPAVNNVQSQACATTKSALAEGYHYATLIGKVTSGTGNWYVVGGLVPAVTARIQ